MTKAPESNWSGTDNNATGFGVAGNGDDEEDDEEEEEEEEACDAFSPPALGFVDVIEEAVGVRVCE